MNVNYKKAVHDIKVNIPTSEENFKSGFGEGVWVLVEPEVHEKYNSDVKGEVCWGILDNNSCYYKGLDAGTEIPFELRGDLRPVVLLDFLKDYELIEG